MAEKKKRPSSNARTKAKARVRGPRLERDDLVQRGEKGLLLLDQHPEVVDRLEPGAKSELRAGLDVITEKREAAEMASIDSRAATAAQNESAEKLAKKTSATRNAILKQSTSVAVRRGYGLHKPINPKKIVSITAAAKAIVKRATGEKTKAEALSFGIVEADVTEFNSLIAEVESADREQEKVRASKPLSTRERDKVANQIWAAIKNISAKGILTFPFDETIRAQFDELDDLPKRRMRG